MAVTYGFFDSINGDRKYSADEFGQIFEGIISDGVMANSRNGLKISPGPANVLGRPKVTVGAGKAWFNNHYIVNDASYDITLDNPQDHLPSGTTSLTAQVYFTIYILVDTRNTDGGRSCSIKTAYGVARPTNEDITPPTISTETGQYAYRLADIHYTDSDGGSGGPIVSAQIEDRRTFSTLLLETEEVSQALSQSY